MEAKAKKLDELYLRKIDIKSWKSDVARMHGIRSIPHFILYNGKGEIVARGQKALRKVMSGQLSE